MPLSLLLLLGCPAASPTDSADTDTDDTDTDDTDVDPPVDFGGLCLVEGCDLPAIGAAALAACEDALSAGGQTASAVQVNYLETGGFTQGATGSVTLNCSDPGMDDPICADLCGTLGFANHLYTDILSDCGCLSGVDHTSARVIAELGSLTCDPADADLQIGVNRGTADTIGGTVTCRNGAAFLDDCDTVLADANREFSTALTQGVGFGAGCGIAD